MVTFLKFEWRQLLRQPFLLIMLLFYMLMGFYSLYTGHAIIQKQVNGLDSLHKMQAEHLQSVRQRFHDTSRTMAAQAGIPQVIAFRHPPYAFYPPHRLAMLAVGQRDLVPYYDLVNSKRDVLTPPNAEFVNAEKLAAGNFDLSYVIIYLFPLLIIAWCHNVLSEEQENQTDKLLAIQGAGMQRIIVYKLLFRFIVISLLAIGLSIPRFTADAVLWLYLLLIYFLCWFVLCWLVILFERSSRWNLLCTLGVWLVLVIAMPAVTNSSISLYAPVPLRSELASRQRECKEETWAMSRTALIDSFYLNHPAYSALRLPSDTAEYGNRRFIAYGDLLARRTDRIMMDYKKEISRHNHVLQQLLWFNPVTQMQHLLYATAESGLDDYAAYEEQVNLFQQEWVTFMNSYLLYDKRLTEADLAHLPVFHYKFNPGKIKSLLLQSISIWLAIVIMLLAGKFYILQLNKR
jgi:ABC-2 type transport system permease protein